MKYRWLINTFDGNEITVWFGTGLPKWLKDFHPEGSYTATREEISEEDWLVLQSIIPGIVYHP